MTRPIDDLALFLAHALALEEESAERYRDLAGNLAAHNNSDVAALFEKMAHYGDLHAAEVREHAADLSLPKLAPWEFSWPDAEGPETQPFEGMHYQLNDRAALELALIAERHGQAFYAAQAEVSSDDAVRELAAEFADEEAEHVRLLEAWIDRTPGTATVEDDDPDPPNVVD